MAIDFNGRVAIVTGSGGGLGRSHALLLARHGAKVVVNDPGGAVDGRGGDNAIADTVVEEIRAAGGEAVANYDSVASWDGAQNIIRTAVDNFGKLDILVNNAGILRDRSFAKLSLEDFEAVMDVHFKGTVYCTKAAWPLMADQAYGRIVLTTSGSGLQGNFGQSAYGAAKAAMIGFQNVLRLEGERKNIRINSICPVADTRMTGSLMDPNVLKYISPEHVSTAVGWLCSEACDVTGEIVVAGGGCYAAVRYYRSDGIGFDPAEPASIDDFADAADELFDFDRAVPYKGFAGKITELLKDTGLI